MYYTKLILLVILIVLALLIIFVNTSTFDTLSFDTLSFDTSSFDVTDPSTVNNLIKLSDDQFSVVIDSIVNTKNIFSILNVKFEQSLADNKQTKKLEYIVKKIIERRVIDEIQNDDYYSTLLLYLNYLLSFQTVNKVKQNYVYKLLEKEDTSDFIFQLMLSEYINLKNSNLFKI